MPASTGLLIPQRRISKARTQLILHRPFWGFLVLNLEPSEKKGLAFGTMGTDGTKLYYDPDGQMNEWTDEQLMSATAHEAGHCAFGHIWRIGNRIPLIWNMATDYALNALLKKDGFTLHPSWLYDSKFENMTAETIYAKLLNDDGKVSGNRQTLDDPDIWKAAGNKSRDENKENEKSIETESDSNSQQDELYWKNKIVQAANVAKMAGKLPGHLTELIENLVDPKLNWKEILREQIQRSVKNNYRIMPPHKKYLWMPLYLPSLKGQEIEIAWCLDTSGSISTEEARIGLSELRGILEQFTGYTVHYFQCDYHIQDYRVLTPENKDSEWTTEVKGRGGTSFCPVFEEIKERDLKPSILIYFTDLEGVFPDTAPDYPVIWLTTVNGNPPFGEKIFFTND